MATILRPPLLSQGQPKRPIAPVDYFSRPLTLGINPNCSVSQLSDSAPQRTWRVHIDVYPNLLGTTLGSAPAPTLDLPLRSGRVFDSAPRKVWQPDSLQSQGLIVYDGPEAAIASLTDSAPQRRKTISLEQPINLLTNTLAQGQPPALGLPQIAGRADLSAPKPRKQAAYGFDAPNLLVLAPVEPLGLPLTAGRADASAPILKYQVRVESLYRPVTLGINPNAVVAQLSASAPPPKKAAYAFDPPNLICSTLAERLELPRFAGRLDWSAPQPPAQKYLDADIWFSPDTPSAPNAPTRAKRVVKVSPQPRRVIIKPH